MNTWYLHTKKTKESIEIPLNSFAMDILRRYKSELRPLPTLTNAKTNELLKDIGKAAGLEELIKIVDCAGNRKNQTAYQKWELLTTHVKQVSFVDRFTTQ